MPNSAVQRTGERVTAEEIRYVASELEDTLGGVYSILSQELQLPLVRVLL
ncbi:portal protein [Escherichia coli]